MCGIAGALDLTGHREFSRPAPGHDRRDRPPRARRRAYPPEPGVALGRPHGSRSSTWPAAGSRSPTRTAPSGSPSTASSSSIPSSARNCSPAATAWRPAATPRRGSTSTRTIGEGMFEKARGQFAVSLWDRRTGP